MQVFGDEVGEKAGHFFSVSRVGTQLKNTPFRPILALGIHSSFFHQTSKIFIYERKEKAEIPAAQVATGNLSFNTQRNRTGVKQKDENAFTPQYM